MPHGSVSLGHEKEEQNNNCLALNLTIVDARSVLANSGPSFRPGQSEIVAARRIVVSGDMLAVDFYCGGLMERLDPTFSKSKRLQRQLEYAQSLGLGDANLARAEVLEV